MKKCIIVADWRFFINLFLWFAITYAITYLFYLLREIPLLVVAGIAFIIGSAVLAYLQPFGTFWHYNSISEEDIRSFFAGKRYQKTTRCKMNKKGEVEVGWAVGIVAAIILFIVGIAFIYPTYNVWASRKSGEATLAEAEYSRQVAVKEAQAKKDSATLLAEAEVSRAEGVAKANKIIGDSLKNNEDYLRYLWITDVAGANIDKTVVYVPTEANLPILEANRMK